MSVVFGDNTQIGTALPALPSTLAWYQLNADGSVGLAPQIVAFVRRAEGVTYLALPAGVLAQRADAFVNSIGTNVRPDQAPYTTLFPSAVVGTVADLGIRTVRSKSYGSGSDSAVGLTSLLAAESGPSFVLTAQQGTSFGDQSPQTYMATHVDPTIVTAWEGPEDVDTSSYAAWGGSAANVTTFMSSLKSWRDGNGNATVRATPIVTPSVRSSTGSADWSTYAAYGNAQPYPTNGTEPGAPLAASLAAVKPTFASLTSVIVTETGYETAPNATSPAALIGAGISAAAQAKYLPRLFAEYFKQGVATTFPVELMDLGADLTNGSLNYGLTKSDGTYKPVATSIKNLISILSERTWTPPSAVVGTAYVTDTFTRANQAGWGTATSGADTAKAWIDADGLESAHYTITSNAGVVASVSAAQNLVGDSHSLDQEIFAQYRNVKASYSNLCRTFLRYTDPANYYSFDFNPGSTAQVSLNKGALTPPSSLRAMAVAHGFKMGAAVKASALAAGGTYAATLAAEYNSVTPENAMKFTPTEQSQGVFTYTDADALVSFAQANGMEVHGHNLVWVDNCPNWILGGTWTKATLQAVMQNHINHVMGHFAGQAATWDVVNEPLDGTGAYKNGLPSGNTWYTIIGTDYIDNAFTYARAADPAAKLYLNDDGLMQRPAKMDAYYTLVSSMISRGIPIDGIGFECHVDLSSPPGFVIHDVMQRFADLGLDVRVTELDVRLATGQDTAGTAQALIYADYIDACLRVSRCKALTTWGFTDNFSSIPTDYPGYGRALPFDTAYAKKAAYTSLFTRLATTPPVVTPANEDFTDSTGARPISWFLFQNPLTPAWDSNVVSHNNLDWAGATARSTTHVTGADPYSLSIPTTSDHAGIALSAMSSNFPFKAATTGFTIGGWYYVKGNFAANTVMSYMTNFSATGWAIGASSTIGKFNGRVYSAGGTADVTQTGAAFAADGWHHVVMRWNGTGVTGAGTTNDITLWIDGVSAATPVNRTSVALSTANGLSLYGSATGATNYYEFFAFDVAITDAQIASIYAHGLGGLR